MKYIVTDTQIFHNGNIYEVGKEIELSKEEAEKLLKKGRVKYQSQLEPVKVKGLNLN